MILIFQGLSQAFGNMTTKPTSYCFRLFKGDGDMENEKAEHNKENLPVRGRK